MDRRVKKTLQQLRTDPRRLSVPALAASVGLGCSRLQHLFKRDVSLSIRNWLERRRMRMAAQLLLSTELRISEVAQAVGFHDASNFTHAFRRHWGMSPRQFRENGGRR